VFKLCVSVRPSPCKAMAREEQRTRNERRQQQIRAEGSVVNKKKRRGVLPVLVFLCRKVCRKLKSVVRCMYNPLRTSFASSTCTSLNSALLFSCFLLIFRSHSIRLSTFQHRQTAPATHVFYFRVFPSQNMGASTPSSAAAPAEITLTDGERTAVVHLYRAELTRHVGYRTRLVR
jgi:hypothetical protein